MPIQPVRLSIRYALSGHVVWTLIVAILFAVWLPAAMGTVLFLSLVCALALTLPLACLSGLLFRLTELEAVDCGAERDE